ncbi:hypothetical protein DOY81_002443 [Sarcophaga bullata]|nr:hypothetical protein DOY81_002443 [Sarcophaga bullata]
MESSANFIRSSNTKRFVIEDSITKVTSDGQPHEMMTMIAGLSGLLAAIVILTILLFLVACNKSKNKHECDRCSETGSPTANKRSSTLSDDSIGNSSTATIIHNPKQLQVRSISAICERRSSGNLQCNLNKAFESSELDLNSSFKTAKQKKKTHWQDEVELARDTTIQIERY